MLVSSVNQETVKQVVMKGGEGVAKGAVNCVMIRSAVVKTTTSALSTATNVLVDRGCGCGGNSASTAANGTIAHGSGGELLVESDSPEVAVAVEELIVSPCC